jgi:hypothetical protein
MVFQGFSGIMLRDCDRNARGASRHQSLKLEVAVESEGDNRGILGLDDGISAGMSALRTTVQIAADNAGPEQLEELVRWSDSHSPVGCTVRDAAGNTLVVHTA